NNKLKRLQFAKCKSDFQWDRVIWSDETKIKLFGNKHLRWVWRRQKDSHTEKHLIPIVKYGGGSLTLWGCFSSKGPGHLFRIHGIMDSNKYQQILNENLTRVFPGSKWVFGAQKKNCALRAHSLCYHVTLLAYMLPFHKSWMICFMRSFY